MSDIYILIDPEKIENPYRDRLGHFAFEEGKQAILSHAKKINVDERAVKWLIDCLIADAHNQKVSRFSDYMLGKTPQDLTMDELYSDSLGYY